ncbi:MAG: hypothetical protein OSB00_01750 [Sphingomonas bacterium]|nr:hypothetical protein [Sphingomonas bacterium]
MTTHDQLLTHWPEWMRTAGALLRSNSLVRSRCSVCEALLRVDLAALAARHGPDWSLIDRRERCAVVGCAGSSVFLASWTYGRAWRELSSDGGGSAVMPIGQRAG